LSSIREWADLKRELGLAADQKTFRVVWDSISDDPNVIAIQSRTVLQILISLARGVAVDEDDVEEGRTIDIASTPEEWGGLPLRVHSGRWPSRDAYVSVRYRGRSFWIEDTDVESKRTFAYLWMVFTVLDPEDTSGPGLVITTN
jgi:hypothetical protein